MGDQHQGRAACSMQRKDKIDHLGAGMTIEIAGRFVCEQNLRPRGERPRQRHALLLSAGKLRGVVMQAMSEPNLCQRLTGADRGLVGYTGQFEGDRHIFQGRHCLDEVKGLQHDTDPAAAKAGQRILVHTGQLGAIHDHAAAACALDPSHHRHQRRLARPRWPEDGHGLAPLYVQRDPA